MLPFFVSFWPLQRWAAHHQSVIYRSKLPSSSLAFLVLSKNKLQKSYVLFGHYGVGLRIISRSFTEVNSLLLRLPALYWRKNKLQKFIVYFRKCVRRRIVGQSFTEVNSLFLRLPALYWRKNKLQKFIVYFRKCVRRRIVGQSFTGVNSFPPRLPSLFYPQINFKIV